MNTFTPPSLLRRRQMMMSKSALPIFHNYLVFDGNAQIDTDIPLPLNGAIKTFVMLGNKARNQGLFSAKDESNNDVVTIFSVRSSDNTGSYRYGYGVISYSASGGINWTNHKNCNAWITPKACSFLDNTRTLVKGDILPTKGIIIGYGKPNCFEGGMGVFYIYDNSAENITSLTDFESITPLYTLHPCEYNGTCGFWCIEKNKFYGNSSQIGTITVAD